MSGAVPRGLVVYRALPCLLPRVAHVVDRYCTLGTVVYRVVSPCLLPRVARFSNFFLHPPVHVLVVAWCLPFVVTSGASTSRCALGVGGAGQALRVYDKRRKRSKSNPADSQCDSGSGDEALRSWIKVRFSSKCLIRGGALRG